MTPDVGVFSEEGIVPRLVLSEAELTRLREPHLAHKFGTVAGCPWCERAALYRSAGTASEPAMHHDFQLAAFIAVCVFVITLMALYLHNL